MAFQSQKLTIVPSGLNLVPPGDQVGEGDCLELTGWWPGSKGRLQQARGWVLKNSGPVGKKLDTLAEAAARVYYAGEGSLFQVGRDAGGAAIDTGYDGAPLGVCAYADLLWVMNRAKQTRDDGTSTYPWAVEVPGQPTLAVSAGGGLVDGTHEYYITFVDKDGYESNPCATKTAACPPGAASVGTVSVVYGNDVITLSGGSWTSAIDGQQFQAAQDPGINYTVAFVDSTHATLDHPFEGATNTAALYTISASTNTSKVTLTRPAAATPARVASWNVYRASPGSGSVYGVNSAPIAYATSSYVDYGDGYHNQDQDTLIGNDVVMEGDHDPPPLARVMADTPYNGRLVVANSADHPNRIWYTPALRPSFFPGSANPQAGNWVDVGNDGDEIQHITVRPGMLIVYRHRSVWRIIGDFEDPSSTIAPLVPNAGVVGPRAVASTSTGDIALMKQGEGMGVYRISDWAQGIDAKVEPIFNGIASECYSAINLAAAATCAVGYQLGRLWISYPDGTNTYPNRVLTCNTDGEWFSRVGGFADFLHGSLFFLAAGNGKIWALDGGTGDEDGGNTPLAYQSGYLDAGNPDHEKSFGDLVISHNTRGADLTVKAKLNKGASTYTLATINSTTLTRQEIPMLYPTGPNTGMPIEAFNISVRIEGSGPKAFPGAIIDSPILLHYFLKPRKATTWDSGPTDHGQTGVKVVDALEIDYDGGALTLFYQSDLPGGTLAERSAGSTGISIPASSGRQVRRIILPASVNGRILRYQLYAQAATAPFLLYRVRVRALPVGVYVDGSFGDTWFTEPIAAGA